MGVLIITEDYLVPVNTTTKLAYRHYNNAYKLDDFDGGIEIQPNLGTIIFDNSVKLNGGFLCKEGSGIKVKGDLDVKGDIVSWRGIEVHGGLICGGSITNHKWNIDATKSIRSYGNIKVSGWVNTLGSIQCGGRIEAHSIYFGKDLLVGLGVSCIQISKPAFANEDMWRNRCTT